MEIIVDYREKQLIPLLENLKIKGKFKNLEIKRENLPIGDVIIKDKNGEEKLIIEILLDLLVLHWRRLMLSVTQII